MKIESKRQRIDSDRGYLVLRPDEFAKLKTALNESDGFDPLAVYSKNKAETAKQREFVIKQLSVIEHFSLDDDISRLGNMPQFNKHMGEIVGRMFGRSQIAFVDHGMFKFVAVFIDGNALKIGLRDGGLKDEIKNSLDFPDMRCFPALLDYDEKTWNSCMVEAVNPKFEDSDCVRFYGVTRNRLVNLLAGGDPVDDPARTFLKNLDSGEGSAWDSIRDLKRFFRDSRLLYDISDGNWGIAMRNGQEVPVVLDYDI